MTKKIQSVSPYQISSELQTVIAAANAALAQRKAINDAISSTEAELETARAENEAAAQAAASAEADFVIGINQPNEKELEAIADAAQVQAETARLKFERAERVLTSLYLKASEADTEIGICKSNLHDSTNLFYSEATRVFTEQLTESIKPLLKQLSVARALQNSLAGPGNHALGELLAEIKIPDPLSVGYGHALLDGSYVKIDGQLMRHSDLVQQDPAAAAIAEALTPIKETQQKLNEHSPFVHPKDQPRPARWKGQTVGFDLSPPKAAATAASPKFQGRSSSNPPAEPTEMNVAAVMLQNMMS